MTDKDYYGKLQITDVIGAKRFMECLVTQIQDQQSEAVSNSDFGLAQTASALKDYLGETIKNLDLAITGFKNDLEFFNIISKEDFSA